jgi:uncharacterized RDD family membrane protein YckC
MEGARPAGFWIRTVAALVDFTVFALVQLSFRVVAGRRWGADGDDWALSTAVALFTLFFTAAYTSVLHAVAGQTIGKLLVGVRVLDESGDPPTLAASFLRYLGYYLSAATFGFGFLMAGLRGDKRALHDLLAGTRVERLVVPRLQPTERPAAPIEPLGPITPPGPVAPSAG